MKPILLLSLLCLTGCSSIGLRSERIFQAKVVEPAREIITEDIRQAADYLASESQQGPQQEVAIDLSQRVGRPEQAISDPLKISKALSSGAKEYRRDLKKVNHWLDKYDGEELENTGLSIWGTGGLFAAIAVVALCILVPAFIPLVFQIIRIISGTSRAAFKQTTGNIHDAIKEFGAENPESFEKLKSYLSRKMDARDKALIKKIDSRNL